MSNKEIRCECGEINKVNKKGVFNKKCWWCGNLLEFTGTPVAPAPAIEGKEEDQKPAMEQLYRFVYAGERQPKEIGKRYGVIFWNGKYGEAVYHGGNHWIEAHSGTINPTKLAWLSHSHSTSRARHL